MAITSEQIYAGKTERDINQAAREKAFIRHTNWLNEYHGGGYQAPEVVIAESDKAIVELQRRLWSPQVTPEARVVLLGGLLFEEMKKQTISRWLNPAELLDVTEGIFEVPRLQTSASSPVPNPLLVSEGIEAALRDLKKTKQCTVEHMRKFREAWCEFSELNPGLTFHDIKFQQAKEHLFNLLRLPNRRTIKARYKSLDINEVIELDIQPKELLSNTTINERMKRLANLWGWAAEHDACEGNNPFRSKSLRLAETPRERGRYSSKDIKFLLGSALFTDDKFRGGSGGHRSWWWLIMLGLYTGARIGELAQLTLKDVVEVEGVHCLSINEEADKKVKTPAGIRLCPVHPELLRLGFLEYVETLRVRGVHHVLPYPNAKTHDAPQRCSKWFNGTYRPNHLPEVWQEENKVFHSFRHTFINRALTELQLGLHLIQTIVGHEREGMGESRRYAKGRFKVKDLFEVMRRFNYEDVNLDLLAGGWKALARD